MKASSHLPTPRFLTVPEVGKICGVSRNTVYNWVKKGVLDAYQTPGRTNLIRPGDLVLFMRGNGMFVPNQLLGMAEEDAESVGFVPKSELNPKTVASVVLFISDEDKDQSIADRALRATAEVVTASTGYEGLHLLTTRPDITMAFVKLNLPGLDGKGTIEQMAALRPNLPVVQIAESGQELPPPSELVKQTLTKPLRLNMLRDAFSTLSA